MDTTRRRKWNSVLHLPEESSAVLPSVPPSPSFLMEPSNLKAVSQAHFSVSNPEISVSTTHLPGNEGEDQTDCTGTPTTPIEPYGEFTFTPTMNKSRQRKFDRHFKLEGEEVIDYYSCALVEDIMLQGFLYISRNYFAFYSNVFNHITKVVIPITNIEKITKTKTAFFIPNAIDVQTPTRKYVFSSFISRSKAINQMQRVLSAMMCNGKAGVIESFSTEERISSKVKLSRQNSPPESSSDTNSTTDVSPTTPSKRVAFVLEEVESYPSDSEKKIPGVMVCPPEAEVIYEEEEPPPPSPVFTCPRDSAQNFFASKVSAPSTPQNESKLNKNLLRLCYVLTLLLTISAVNMYIRVENLTNQNYVVIPRNHFDQNDHLRGEDDSFELEAAKAMLEKINDNIRRISLVHKVLEEFSTHELHHGGARREQET